MMPDVDKTIRGLTAFLECNSRKCDGCEYQDKKPGMPGGCKLDQYQVLEDALDLLKEQEAVEPKVIRINDFGHPVYACGKCGLLITESMIYCHECGKRINWEGR